MRKCKLGEIAKFKTGPFGTQFKAAEYTQSGYPVINVKNIGIGRIIDNDIEFVSEKTRNRLSEHIIHEGDIVFARKGSVERHTYVRKEHDGWVQGSDCIKAKIDAGIEPRYVSYYLCLESVKKQLMLKAVGSTMPSMNTDILKDIAITLPDDEGVEKRIADFFDNINEKILSNEKTIDTLESMAKTLYDYWFVQFEFPDANGRPYKTSGGKMEWNETLSREIPAGWEVGQVCDLGEVIAGGTPSTEHPEYFTSEGIAWITPKDMSLLDGKYIFHGGTDISEEGLKNSSAKLMPAGSVVYTTRAPIGYVAIAGNDVCTNQGFKSVVPKKDFGTEFVYYTLKSLEVHFKNVGNGSTFSEVSKETFSTVPICIPPRERIREFMLAVDRLSDMQKKTQLENRKLIALRDFLLPMLMNGQVIFIN